jgi:pyruvate ferredoxin oxidoreductase alpha subunit
MAIAAKQERRVIEGSMAVAEMVKRCRPHVVSAYPITPQTHIVEDISEFVADGEMQCEFINCESEFSAISICLGASATGSRVYTATSSQGLLLMTEVLFNVSGLRLPILLTCANRAVSSPLSIWNDQQDSIAMRDSGWMQFYGEDNQEVADLHLQAYKIAEDHRVLLPVMVCMDGFILTHAFEPVELPAQEDVDAFLPPYQAVAKLDPQQPITMGAFADPNYYMEIRWQLEYAMQQAPAVIEQVAAEFEQTFGRPGLHALESYRTEGAETIILGLGSMLSAIKDTVDELRAEGEPVGAIKLRWYRPFPRQQLIEALRGVKRVAVMEKDISLGMGGAVCADLRSALYDLDQRPAITGFVVGLGGRDITNRTVRACYERVQRGPGENIWVELDEDLLDPDMLRAWKQQWT